MPSVDDTMELPEGTSATLKLVQASGAEMIESSTMNAISWRGPVDVDAYLRREAHLRTTDLNRDGGITYWILVDTAAATGSNGRRRILSSCETIRKRALVAQSSGRVKDVISHGIGSLYCHPAYRGRGYAQRMLVDLAKILDTWQQNEGDSTDFSVLWSDIGGVFYARLGWKVYPSTHIALSPKLHGERLESLPTASVLTAEDLEELCRTDEAWIRSDLSKPTSSDAGMRVALVPDVKTMQWHHAREEFLAQELLGRLPLAKGALATTTDGKRAWCIWTRSFGVEADENVLNILRLVVEGENSCGRQAINAPDEGSRHRSHQPAIIAIASILRAAQLEASEWGMASVQFWNPSPLSVLAAEYLDPSTKIICREDESLTSLRWHKESPSNPTTIDWISNEKYGWC
ncbi:MAG: hypothetical protein LQ352_002526 [Teloschistes flavicans]|nr:MAG: hypothetical protein LQ352_002526 [Teloschistes flavicans]